MNFLYNPIHLRTCGFLIILLIISSGCQKNGQKSQEHGSLTLANEHSRKAETPSAKTSPTKTTTTTIPPKKEKEVELPPKPPKITNSELSQLNALLTHAEKSEWYWEKNAKFKRQRPVLLVVVSTWGLQHTLPTTLKSAATHARIGWDVKILLHESIDEKATLHALQHLEKEINLINQDIEKINSLIANREEKEFKEVAPRCKISPAKTFGTSKQLMALIDTWLSKNFQFISSDELADPNHPSSRPPFGTISFSGHGKSVPSRDDPTQSNLNLILSIEKKGMEKIEDLFDLGQLDQMILRRYQAPIWITTDACRLPGWGTSTETKGPAAGGQKLFKRDFANFADLDPDQKQIVTESENLRTNVTAGLFHRGGKMTTKWHADEREVSVKDSPDHLLHGYLGDLLFTKEIEENSLNMFFSNIEKKTKHLTLRESELWVQTQFETRKIPKQRPKLFVGNLPNNFVCYSTAIAKDVYQPVFTNLLNGGSQIANRENKPLVDNGFSVLELSLEAPVSTSHYGSLTMVNQAAEKIEDHRNLIEFKEPFQIARPLQYQLVVVVSGNGPDPKQDSIKFTVGVYSSATQLLNSNFATYSKAESHKNPVQCDGIPRLIHIPLDLWNNDKDQALKDLVSMIEFQASPDAPSANWKKGLSLTIHGVYLLPLAVKDDDLNADLERAKISIELHQMCVWDIPLHKNPESVRTKVTEQGSTILSQTQRDYQGVWGISGEIYPKLFVDKDKRLLKVKLLQEDNTKLADNAEIWVCVYSNKVVVATQKFDLKTVTEKEVSSKLIQSGMIDEVVVLVKNHPGALRIQTMKIE